MQFWKMNGAGNDFILLNDLSRGLPDAALPELARTVCQRHTHIGADGLMVVRPPEDAAADFRMLFYNADGSVGEMCGNGARCICRYGYENGLAPRDAQRVETDAGLVTGWYVDGTNWRVRLNDPAGVELDRHLDLEGERIPCSCAVVGVPHAAVEVQGLRELKGEALDRLRELGRKLRNHPSFPRGSNINFYELLGPDRVYLRTYERGVEDFTYACGTGTGATVLCLALRGLLPDHAEAEMRGGVLRVDVEREGREVKNLWLTGPTLVAAKGEIPEETLPRF